MSATHLATNLRALRQTRGLSQQKAADRAGMPRATWATLESGSANPTLTVLLAVSQALDTTLEELLSAPMATGRVVRADTLRRKRRGKVEIRDLLPEPLPGVGLERMELPTGALLVGVPHTAGTREYLTCEQGCLQLTASGDRFTLNPGDVAVFRGDQRHSYENLADGTTIAYSVVLTRD